VTEHTIATTTHGRYLVVRAADGHEPAPLLVGFHGYAESAEVQLRRLQGVPGSVHWKLVSVQALHRFYERRTNQVVASWMTRQDRDLLVADNLAYVSAIVEAEWPAPGDSPSLIFAGFSQGAAMAFRAAASSARPVAGVIAVGGDIPPDIDRPTLTRICPVLLLRGAHDEWYTDDKFADDQYRLRDVGATFTAIEFDGGHEWNRDVLAACATFLQRHT
jgi:predicted esterase